MSILKEGYLLKAPTSQGALIASRDPSVSRSLLFRKRDRRRYFVLQDDGILSYYNDRQHAHIKNNKPRGFIKICPKTEIVEVRASGILVVPEDYTNKQLYISADTPKERDDWKRVFESLTCTDFTRKNKKNTNKSLTENINNASEVDVESKEEEDHSESERQSESSASEIVKSEYTLEWEARCQKRTWRPRFKIEKPVRKQGYVCVKVRSDHINGEENPWNLRYFVLAKDLVYYQSKENYENKAEEGTTFELSAYTVYQSRDCPNEICVSSLDGGLLLRAETVDEALEWKQSIRGFNNVDATKKFDEY